MGIIDRALAQGVDEAAVNKLKIGMISGLNGWQELVTTIVGWVLIIAAVIAFFYLIYSGFMYLTAGGNDEAAKKGQKGIMNAVIGIVIIVLSYAITFSIVNFTKSGSGASGTIPHYGLCDPSNDQCAAPYSCTSSGSVYKCQ